MKLGSLFDGSGTCPLAATLCGITPVWASEIEPYPIRVTRKNFPEMRHLGDITKINGAEIEPVDIVTFGSPCQDLSAAGAQKGLVEGKRSVLFFDAIRIVKEMRGATHGKYPHYVIWENVPGAFSSNKGHDFLAVLQAFVEAAGGDGTDVPEPASKGGRLKWGNAGSIVGEGFSIAWRVLDAQYWGVPQRRKRIYLVADFGGQHAAEVLFKREGLRRNFAQSRKAWEETTADAVGSTGRNGGAWNEKPDINKDSSTPSYPNVFGGVSYLFEPRSAFDEDWTEADVKNALRARASTSSHVVCYALQGNGIDRSATAGCNGKGWNEDICYTLNTVDRPATVYQNLKRGEYVESEIGSTLLAHLAKTE